MLLIGAGFLLPLPYDPVQPNIPRSLEPPSVDYWFGTDKFGFDIFSRTIAAAQRDLPLALVGTVLSLVIGAAGGLMVSTKGSRWGERVMRGLDAFEAFPLIILAIAIVTVTGNRMENVVLALVIINVPRFMRLVRSEALTLRESRFVEAASALGASRSRIMLRHILPNVTDVLLVQSSLATAHALLTIAGLSFLGVGVSPPEPSWGAMIQDGARAMVTGQWWIVLFPGLAVVASVASLNFMADGFQRLAEDAGG